MYRIDNYINNDDIKILETLGPFTVVEYQRDLSVSPSSAQTAYFSAAMNVPQASGDLRYDQGRHHPSGRGPCSGMVGNVSSNTGIKGCGRFLRKSRPW